MKTEIPTIFTTHKKGTEYKKFLIGECFLALEQMRQEYPIRKQAIRDQLIFIKQLQTT